MGEVDNTTDKRKPPDDVEPGSQINTLDVLGIKFKRGPANINERNVEPPIGTATIDKEGTITLRLKGHGPRGVEGETELIYPKGDPNYREILRHLEGIKPGETKQVRPWDPREKSEDKPPIRGNEVTPPDATDASKPVEAPPAASDEFKKSVQEQYDKMPEPLRKKLEADGYQIKAVPRITDAMPELVGEKPRGWPPGSTWDHVDGAYSPSKKTIVVAAHHRSGNKWVENSSPDGVTRHELGHAVDDAFDYSNSKEFKDAYAKDIAKIPQDKQDKLSYFLQAGEAGRQEAFAEIFAVLQGGASYPGYTKDIQTYFPETIEAMRIKIAAQTNPVTTPTKSGP